MNLGDRTRIIVGKTLLEMVNHINEFGAGYCLIDDRMIKISGHHAIIMHRENDGTRVSRAIWAPNTMQLVDAINDYIGINAASIGEIYKANDDNSVFALVTINLYSGPVYPVPDSTTENPLQTLAVDQIEYTQGGEDSLQTLAGDEVEEFDTPTPPVEGIAPDFPKEAENKAKKLTGAAKKAAEAKATKEQSSEDSVPDTQDGKIGMPSTGHINKTINEPNP